MSKVCRIKKEIPTWEEALQQFLYYKQATGRKNSTIGSYKDVIRIFYNRYKDAWDKPKEAIYKFLSEDIKPATYNIRLTYMKSFFDWCREEGILTENPLTKFKKRRAEGRTVHIKDETLTELILAPNLKTFAGLRDHVLIMLTLDNGIRPSEAFSLLPNDINLKALEVYVRSEVSKTKVGRTLPISHITCQVIRELLKYRHPEWRESTPVFCTADGTKLNRHTWNDRLEMHSKKLGVKICPYDLRHAFAVSYLRNGGNALSLQRILGHADLSMTKRYVALTQDDLRDQHSLASPLNKLIPQKKRVRNIR